MDITQISDAISIIYQENPLPILLLKSFGSIIWKNEAAQQENCSPFVIAALQDTPPPIKNGSLPFFTPLPPRQIQWIPLQKGGELYLAIVLPPIEELAPGKKTLALLYSAFSSQIREPLSSLPASIAHLSRIVQEHPEERQKSLETLNSITRSTLQVLRTLDTISAVLYSHSSQISVDFAALVEELSIAVSEQISSLGLSFQFTIPYVTLPVAGNNRSLSVGFLSLVSFALEHAPPNSLIRLSLKKTGKAAVLQVHVPKALLSTDSLSLLEKPIIENLLEENYMGLVATKAIAIEKKGSFSGENIPGGGFILTLSLPLLPGIPLQVAQSRTPYSGGPFSLVSIFLSRMPIPLWE